MTEQKHELRGILPVLQTPYLESGEIDYDTLEREIQWLFDCGCDGIVVAMVSEVLRLSHSENRELSAFVCRVVDQRGPVVLSVGGESINIARENAVYAEKAGATGVMAIPPIAVGALGDELLEYYEAIAQSTSLPVIVQDASGYVGKPLSIELQAEILQRFGPEKIYFKPEAPPIGQRLSALRDATHSQARIFEGTGGIALVDSYRRGIVGTMPGSDLIRGVVALYQALQNGDEQRIYQLSLPISAIAAAQHSLEVK